MLLARFALAALLLALLLVAAAFIGDGDDDGNAG